MKKIFVLMLVLSLALLTACGCEHEWKGADCETPKTCTKCGATEGAPAGHSWLAATCEAPKTCEDCDATEGEALPHSWLEATCQEPQTCEDCDATEGEALGHQWTEATYSAPKTCSVCAATEGDALVREDLGMTVEQFEEGLGATLQLMDYELNYLGNDDYGFPVYEIDRASTGEYTNAFLSLMIDPALENVYALYTCAEDCTDINAVTAATAAFTLSLGGIDENFDLAQFEQLMQQTPELVDGVAYYKMDSCGLTVDVQIDEELALFMVYPAE